MVRHRSRDFALAADRPPGDAAVTGHGLVQDRPVFVFAQDFTVFGGSVGEVAGEKITRVMDLAMRSGAPIVGISDGVGGRIQEGVVAQGSYGEIFARNVRMSGLVPQISLMMGPCAGGAAYSAALTDFVIMVDGSSHMFLTGPAVVREATGEDVGLDELGGAWTHSTRSGTAHHCAATEAEAIRYARELLSHLPSDGERLILPASPEPETPDPGLETILPEAPGTAYDVRAILTRVLDHGRLLEVQQWYAASIVVGLGRLDGRSVGVVANQALVSGGRLDMDASEKAARFIRTCDAFGIPVVSFVDVRDHRLTTEQEQAGGARRCAKLACAYAESTVPLLTVIIRHAEGIGHVVMGSRAIGADLVLAWPTARIGGLDLPLAAECGQIDAVIEPAGTRISLCRALRRLDGRPTADRPPRKHENLPL
jgi:propionyl-CoA carboxylase beta chain